MPQGAEHQRQTEPLRESPSEPNGWRSLRKAGEHYAQDLDKLERDRRDHIGIHEAAGVGMDTGEDTEEARGLWNRMAALIIAQPAVTDMVWDAWLAKVPPRMGKGGELILLVPTPHNITWLERRLDLRSCYSQAGGTAYLRLLLDPAADDAAQ